MTLGMGPDSRIHAYSQSMETHGGIKLGTASQSGPKSAGSDGTGAPRRDQIQVENETSIPDKTLAH